MSTQNVYSPDYDNQGNPKPSIPDLKDAIENAVVDAENFASATGSFTDADGNTFQKGAKGWAADADTSETDAQKHAQETGQYTDSQGDTYEKGAKGYRDEIDNIGFSLDGLTPPANYHFTVKSDNDFPIFSVGDDGFYFLGRRIVTVEPNTSSLRVEGVRDKAILEVFKGGGVQAAKRPLSESLDESTLKRKTNSYDTSKIKALIADDFRYYSFPRSTEMPNGDLLVSFSDRPFHNAEAAIGIGRFKNRHTLTSISRLKFGTDEEAEPGDFLFLDNGNILFAAAIGDLSNNQKHLPPKIFESTDKGITWSLKTTLPTKSNNPYPQSLRYSHIDSTIYMIGWDRTTPRHMQWWESTDNGSTWNRITRTTAGGGMGDENDFHIIDHDGSDPTTVISISRKSVSEELRQVISTDGGSTWSTVGSIPGIDEAPTRPKLYRASGSLVAFFGQRPDRSYYYMSCPIETLRQDPNDLTGWSRPRPIGRDFQAANTGDAGYGDIVFGRNGPSLVYYDDPKGIDKPNIYAERIGIPF